MGHYLRKKQKPGWHVEFTLNGQRGFAQYGPGYKRNELITELQKEVGEGIIEIIKVEKAVSKLRSLTPEE